jgi:uncharacterized protein YkwD
MSFLDSAERTVKVSANLPPATVNPAAAAAMVSNYRQSKGLSRVTLDSRLMAIANRHAQAMARAGKVSHAVAGEPNFPRRLSAGGYNAAIAAENVAGGQRNLDEAFAGWRKSPGHNANLLKPGVTEMGIAVAHSAKSKYRDFWVLVLAAPDTRGVNAGPDAGPTIAALAVR